jgi:hypothetical protein
MLLKVRPSYKCGLLPLPAGAPMGRGSSAVPWLESAPARKLGAGSNLGYL